MTSELGNPSYSERSGKNCVKDLVEQYSYSQDFLHNFSKIIEKILLK